jgi:hypothetical protein
VATRKATLKSVKSNSSGGVGMGGGGGVNRGGGDDQKVMLC